MKRFSLSKLLRKKQTTGKSSEPTKTESTAVEHESIENTLSNDNETPKKNESFVQASSDHEFNSPDQWFT